MSRNFYSVLPCDSSLRDMLYSAWAKNKPFNASLKCQTHSHSSPIETSTETWPATRKYAQQHDDRIGRPGHSRPPNRQMGRQRKFREYHYAGKFKVDNDGDVDMTNPQWQAERRFNPYSKNKIKKKDKKNKNQYAPRSHDDGEGSWYKITIPYGKKSGKMFILRSLTSNCKVPFVPFNFQFNGNSAEFFVNDYAVACQIRDVNRRVTTPEGFKMAVMMCRSPPPISVLNPEIAEAIKKSMSARYDVVTHNLNLSKFHHDPSLKEQGYYVPISKPIIFNEVIKIIKENIPELEILNLSDNRLYSLEALTGLVDICKNLRSLWLKNNKLRAITELNPVKGLNVLDLILDGNPLCDDFKEKNTYVSAARDRFPKLIKLDGLDLPAPIGFDLGPETVPVSKKSFFIAEDVKDLVVQFLDQYYTIYDSGDRSKLLEAYHDQASFSLCLFKHSQKNGNALSPYVLDNRNILRISDNNQRFKLLKQGRLSVVTALSELPQTMHDPSSFNVDIFQVSPGLMTFSVVGVFKEVGADINNASLKTFSRTFVVTSQGQGFVIVNEMLFIANASQEQISKAFKFPAPTPSPSPAPSNEEKSPAEKQALALELSKQTRMNIDFSAKCLDENDWDFARALDVFMKLQSLGTIPPEAFIS